MLRRAARQAYTPPGGGILTLTDGVGLLDSRVEDFDGAADGEPTPPSNISAAVPATRSLAWQGGNIIFANDASLDEKSGSRKWGAISLQTGTPYGYGAAAGSRWTGDLTATFDGADGRDTGYEWQMWIKQFDLVSRCAARGMDFYVGIYSTTSASTATHFADPFDDAAWTTYCSSSLPDGEGIYALVKAASSMGMVGLNIDMENYQIAGGQENGHASSLLLYPGNTHTTQQTRDAWFARGAQLMTCILAAWAAGGAANPIKITFYGDTVMSHTYLTLVQRIINGAPSDYGTDFYGNDFWHGMCSVAGYESITYLDHVLMKTPHISNMSWSSATQYCARTMTAFMSGYFTPAVWKIAHDRISAAPLLWVDKGPPGELPFADTMSEANADLAFTAANRYSPHGVFGFYGQSHDITTVDGVIPWSNYYNELAKGAVTTSPNGTLPTLNVTTLGYNGTNVTFAGTCTHLDGIKYLRWERRTGPTGATVADYGAVTLPDPDWDVVNTGAGYYNDPTYTFNTTISGVEDSWYIFDLCTILDQHRYTVMQEV